LSCPCLDLTAWDSRACGDIWEAARFPAVAAAKFPTVAVQNRTCALVVWLGRTLLRVRAA